MPGYFSAEDGEFYPESVIDEQIASKARVTDHPVEQGVAVSDHSQKLPETATLTIRVTETPLDPNADFITRFSEPPPSGPGVISLGTTEFINPPLAQRPVAALQWLRDHRGQRISYFSTKFPEFSDWVITSVNVQRRNRRALEMKVQLKEVRIGTSQEVSIPARKKRPKKADDKVDKGTQSAKPLKPDKAADSFLFGLLKAGDGGVLGLDADETKNPSNAEDNARKVDSTLQANQ